LQKYPLYVLLGLLCEIAFYLQMRSKANLFLQLQLVKAQQTQLKDVLDLVPESVFVCTKGCEQHPSRPVFANSKTNKFFGADIMKVSKNRKGLTRMDPLKQRYFTERNVEEPSD